MSEENLEKIVKLLENISGTAAPGLKDDIFTAVQELKKIREELEKIRAEIGKIRHSAEKIEEKHRWGRART